MSQHSSTTTPDVAVTVQGVSFSVADTDFFGESEAFSRQDTPPATATKSTDEGVDDQEMDLVGDPLQDLPEATEGGPVVLLKPNFDDIQTFMMRYGIDTGKFKKKQGLVLPAWLKWLVDMWHKAGKEMAEEDGEEISDGDSTDSVLSTGLTEQLRKHQEEAISGKAPAGTCQIAWAMFRMLCVHVEKTNTFNNFFNFLIIFNALFLGMKVDDIWSGGFVNFLDNAFVVLFFIEVVVRLAAYNMDIFKNGFLCFDSAIVLVSVVDLWLLPLLLKFQLDFDFRILYVFRIMRIIRLVRLLQLITWLRPLRLMERSLRRGVSHFMSIVVLLVTIFYASALVFRSLFAGVQAESIWADTPEDYDGNTLKLMMYLLEGMLSGFDWKDKMVDPLLRGKSSRVVAALLIFFMFCSKTALVNLITGSMIENYLTTKELDGDEVRREELHRVLRVKDFEELLEQADTNSERRISWEEFKAFANHANGPKLLNLLGIKPRSEEDKQHKKQRMLIEMRRIFLAFDPVNEGSIPIDMFTMAYLQFKGGDKTLEGLIFDYSLKELLKTARRPSEGTKELDQKIFQISTIMEDEKLKMQNTLLDFDYMVEEVKPSLDKFETTVTQVNESFQFSDDDTKAVPAACAGISHMKLQMELTATREAALAFLKAQGKKIDLSMLLQKSP